MPPYVAPIYLHPSSQVEVLNTYSYTRKRVRMGSYGQLYVGPYISCVSRPKVVDIKVRWCPYAGTATCKQKLPSANDNYTGLFCNLCGSAISSDIVVHKTEHTSPYVVLQSHEDQLAIVEHSQRSATTAYNVYFVANQRVSSREYTIDVDLACALNLLDVDRLVEIDEFSEKYKVEIEVLKGAYEQVRICWGIQYWYQ